MYRYVCIYVSVCVYVCICVHTYVQGNKIEGCFQQSETCDASILQAGKDAYDALSL